MATISLFAAGVARTISGNSPQVLVLPENTSLDVKAGEFVYLSGGYVTECSANPTLILGIAAHDSMYVRNGGSATTAGANNIAVVIANADTIFRANKTTTAGAATTTSVGDVGSIKSIYMDTSNQKAHLCDGGSPRCIVLDHDGLDAVGDTGGRLLFQVAGNFRQMFCTS